MKKALLILFMLYPFFLFSQEKKFEVFFDFDVSETNEESIISLNNFIAQNKDIEVSKIYGYCDKVGSIEYNDTLSLMRANYVYSKLKESEMKILNNLIVKGFGEQFEKSSRDNQNRKVSIFYSTPIKEKSSVTVQNSKKSELSREVEKLKIGDKVKLKNLNFYNRSGIIVPASKPILSELLKLMNEKPTLKIEIQGHICCQEGTDLEEIATIRAKAIYSFLIENGISKSRLKYKGFGSSKPIYPIPEKNEFERDQNRRVEIEILEN